MPEQRDRAHLLDTRGLRFAAGVTAALLLADVALGVIGPATARAASFGWYAYQPLAGAAFHPGSVSPWLLPALTPLDRVLDPAFLLLAAIALLFVWGLVSPRTSPWVALFRVAIAPRLAPPTALSGIAATRLAQALGLACTAAGLLLQLCGVPWALPIAAALAFVAAFLNAAFGLCLGSWLYLALQRAGIVGRPTMHAS